MAKCGKCEATGVSVAHVRSCFGQEAGSVKTAPPLPAPQPGNVVTLCNADGFWMVIAQGPHNEGVTIRQFLPGGNLGAQAFANLRQIEMIFADENAATDYRIHVATEATKRKNRETLHGDPNYCRGCARDWFNAKWHRDDCPVVAARAGGPLEGNHDPSGANLRQGSENPWAAVDALRAGIKPHLLRKVRNATMGHFAARMDGSDVVKFYRIKCVTAGQYAGRVFVDVQASDTLYPIKTPATLEMVLTAILKDADEAAKLYGTELGQCYRCNRTLTDETSRALGIGPECRSK